MTNLKNETHLISTFTLENVTIYDTGYYGCDGRLKYRLYIYISSRENLFFMNVGGQGGSKIITRPGDSIAIPLALTHPDVKISVYRQTREIGVEHQNEFSKVIDGKVKESNRKIIKSSDFK